MKASELCNRRSETRAGDLGDLERRGRQAQRGTEERSQLGGLARNWNRAIRIEQFEHAARGQVDVGRQALDRMGVEVPRIAAGVVREGTHYAAMLRARKI